MTRRGILTGGTWCVDRNLLLNHWPDMDSRAEILSTEIGGGGSGCNLAIAVRALDPAMPVATIALVGDDADGRFLIDEAEAKGIDHSHMMLTGEAATDYTLAFTSRLTGQRTHISYSGTGRLLTPDHFDFSGFNHRLLHLGIPGVHERMDEPWGGDQNGWVTTLKKAHAAGLKSNLELASIAPERIAELVRPCLPHLDFLIVNDSEIGGITGIETVRAGAADPQACLRAAQAALEQGAMQLVVVHFPTGAALACRDGRTIVRPSVRVPPDEIRGANGAGDAFAAGLLYAVHEDWPIDDAIALAHAAAAVSLRSISTMGAIAAWSECLRLADRWGWRESAE
jgi:sugar/nucleoside kinase (ribokinase family)